MRKVLTAKEWYQYFQRLKAIENKAAAEMLKAINARRFATDDELDAYCYALVERYGGAAASLACEMYDGIAVMQGAAVAPAEPAATMTFREVRKTVRDAASRSLTLIAPETGRMVKQASADTILKNARRDHAEAAWVPNGDTCAFCLTLASRGWTRVYGMKAGDHAAHIHANCDCTYSVRFVSDGGVAGYDPEAYRRRYYAAEGNNSHDRINAIRREMYQENREEILAQKREAYAARVEREETQDGE